jgi:hypothetical protein
VICARPTCGKAMGEDEKFGYDMRLRGLPQRRYFCSDGHSLTTGVEEALAKKEVVPLEMRLRALTCQRCDAPLVRRRVDAKYCLPCVRLVDVERLRRERAERAAARAAEPPRCRNGHLVTPETTIVEKKGTKRCLICRTAAWHRSAQQPQRKAQQAAWRARVRARRTHCRAGHLLDEGNTYLHTSGARICRQCRADRATGRLAGSSNREPNKHCRRGHAYGESNPYRRGKWCVVCRTEQQVRRLEQMSSGMLVAAY